MEKIKLAEKKKRPRKNTAARGIRNFSNPPDFAFTGNGLYLSVKEAEDLRKRDWSQLK